MKCPTCQQENAATAKTCRACGAALPAADNAMQSRIDLYAGKLESAFRNRRWRELLAAYALVRHLEAATESQAAMAAHAERALRRRHRWAVGLSLVLFATAALAWIGVREYRARQDRQTMAAAEVLDPPPAPPAEVAPALPLATDDAGTDDGTLTQSITQVDDGQQQASAETTVPADTTSAAEERHAVAAEADGHEVDEPPKANVEQPRPDERRAADQAALTATVQQARHREARERMLAAAATADWHTLPAVAEGFETDRFIQTLARLADAANAHAIALAAKERGDWRAVADSLRHAHRPASAAIAMLAQENQAAALHAVTTLDTSIRALLAEANDHLLPRLTITSLVDGEAVTGASVVILDADGQPLPGDAPRLTPAVVALTRGAAYTIRVVLPPQGETRFRPTEVAYRAERDGPQALAVALDPWPGPLPGEAWTIPELAIVMVPIAAGRFRMGAANGARDERPIREVRLSKPFWLGKHEVTQAAYEALVGRHPNQFEGANLPVESLSWEDAADYCRRLTARESNAGRLPEGYVYRLPTEAEWEYACRAGSVADYAYGNGSARLGDYAWYVDNSGERTHEVGTKKPNAWGLHDLHGNVWEWCHDWAGPYVAGPATDPAGPATGTDRAVRGGGWDATAGFCRSTFRLRAPPANAYPFIGFRIALAPKLP